MHQKLVFLPSGYIMYSFLLFFPLTPTLDPVHSFEKKCFDCGYLLASFSWILTRLTFGCGPELDWTTSSACCPVPVNKHSRASDLSTDICPTPLQPNVIPIFDRGPLHSCQFTFCKAIDSTQSALTDTTAIPKFLLLQPQCSFFLQMPDEE